MVLPPTLSCPLCLPSWPPAHPAVAGMLLVGVLETVPPTPTSSLTGKSVKTEFQQLSRSLQSQEVPFSLENSEPAAFLLTQECPGMAEPAWVSLAKSSLTWVQPLEPSRGWRRSRSSLCSPGALIGVGFGVGKLTPHTHTSRSVKITEILVLFIWG